MASTICCQNLHFKPLHFTVSIKGNRILIFTQEKKASFLISYVSISAFSRYFRMGETIALEVDFLAFRSLFCYLLAV